MSYTAFAEVESVLKSRLKNIDRDSFFNSRVGHCKRLFSQCLGACCSLYVGITVPEARVLEDIFGRRRKDFKDMGIDFRGRPVVYDPETKRYYLAKRRRGFMQLAGIVNMLISRARGNYPLSFSLFRDFSYTCVFLLKNGACALQKIAQAQGRHEWFYKPINCWKYPLSLEEGTLRVFDRRFNRCFPCNQDKEADCTAYEALRPELKFLGQIVGRDLINEIGS